MGTGVVTAPPASTRPMRGCGSGGLLAPSGLTESTIWAVAKLPAVSRTV